MRNWIRKISGMLVLVLFLTQLSGIPVRATEPSETKPAAEENLPAAPQQETESKTYRIDTESEIYKACEELYDQLKCDQILVYDPTNDEILYAYSREGDKLYPASTTKLFSAYVALQYLKTDDVVTVGDELDLVAEGSSLAYLKKGHKLYVTMLIEAMMLPSGNDAAVVTSVAAGRKIAGDEDLEPEKAMQAFVAEMNRMAGELGFEKTHFSNPDGMHLGSHYTCLNDMARIAKLALETPVIAYQMSKFEEDVTFLSGQTVKWKNTNPFLDPEGDFYRGDAIGMKTGFTRQAQYCLMSAFNCGNGQKLVIGAFGSANEYDRMRDINKLVRVVKPLLKK